MNPDPNKENIKLPKFKLGTLLNNHEFIENEFKPSIIDGTIRKGVIQLSGFKVLPNGRIKDQYDNEMDFEVFLCSLKVIKDNDIIIGPNNERIYDIGDEVTFRLLPPNLTIVNSTDYIFPDGSIYLELDFTVPSKVDTVDGYTGALPFLLSGVTFFVSYETFVTDKKDSKKTLNRPSSFPTKQWVDFAKENNLTEKDLKDPATVIYWTTIYSYTYKLNYRRQLMRIRRFLNLIKENHD